MCWLQRGNECMIRGTGFWPLRSTNQQWSGHSLIDGGNSKNTTPTSSQSSPHVLIIPTSSDMTQWSRNSSMSRGTSLLGTLMSSMISHSTTSIQPEQLTLPHPTKGPDWGNLGLEAEKGEGVYPSVDSTI